ncbi:MAG: hypothetical protein O2890_03415 [Cyanobacteria bacterium]|nr:hypothetical protein [Cyanobacteriota bacterium]MDA0865462.1 hypothetical protein [Cyanobacteriota bacterium]
MDIHAILATTLRQRVSDGETVSIWPQTDTAHPLLVVVWPQLGDFDSLEYAWWLQRAKPQIQAQSIAVRAVGIGDRASGQRFCNYTGFPAEHLFVDPEAALHQTLDLYAGLSVSLPGLDPGQKAWLNLMLMCAGIGSPGTLAEVVRGYTGDRQAPQLIAAEESVKAGPLPPLQGKVFNTAGGEGFQRPFELATLRLRNMAEVLSHWSTYVPDATHLTQRGGTFLFDGQGKLVYEHRDRGILGFSQTMANPLAFLDTATGGVTAA